MSQIAAVVAWDPQARPTVSASELSAALARWPSASQHVVERPGAVLGWAPLEADQWRRHDRQPIVDEVARLGIVADCRLDNREKLQRELALPPGSPDSHLLMRAYERWDVNLPKHLRGDFAAVIWDWGRRRVVAFRDPLGIKPLFYEISPHGITVASDVELLVELTTPARVPDDQLVVEHLLWDYHSTDRTFWAGLRRIPAGHTCLASPDGLQLQRYWLPLTAELAVSSREEVHEAFSRVFFESVRRRLDSETPVLIHLSGGIDSSSVVCAADRILRDDGAALPPLTAVSARYPDTPCDEGSFIQAVMGAITLPAESWDGRATTFPELDTPTLAGPGMGTQRTDGSTGDLDIARRVGARVVVTGDGGDQVGWPRGVFEDRVRDNLGKFVRDTLLEPAFPVSRRIARARHVLREVSPTPLRKALAFVRGGVHAPPWLRPKWRGLAASLKAQAITRDSSRFRCQVQRIHWEDLTSARLGRALDLAQRCMAKSGVEARLPFLDQDLVELILSIPTKFWPEPGPYARLQREALPGLLPVAVRDREVKLSFSPLVVRRVRLASGRLRALFYEGPWAAERWVERREAQRLLDRVMEENSEGDGELCRTVRGIGTLEVWLRAVFGYHASSAGGS
jgi:asparagine synthase (glutamine-hydrolysing)